MDKKIGFIGCGNMASAMISGIIESELVKKENILASANTKATLDKVKEKYNINTTLDNKEVAKKSDFIILAIKPYMYGKILEEIKSDIRKDAVVVSIGAGISLDFLKENLNEGAKYIKTMPNTPAMVGEGMSALSPGENMKDADIEDVVKIFNSFGKAEIIEEKLMDGFTALCGSSPAYVYMIIEAMADGGVLEGIPRDKAYTMAAQAVLGGAKMVLDTGMHPGKLKDNVCSPGGTTIEAVASLEENNIRSTMIEAIRTCADKSRQMGK